MTKALERLVAAANEYGDAKIKHEQSFRGWKQGDPVPQGFDRSIEDRLHSAARAYATSTRPNRTPATPGADND